MVNIALPIACIQVTNMRLNAESDQHEVNAASDQDEAKCSNLSDPTR